MVDGVVARRGGRGVGFGESGSCLLRAMFEDRDEYGGGRLGIRGMRRNGEYWGREFTHIFPKEHWEPPS